MRRLAIAAATLSVAASAVAFVAPAYAATSTVTVQCGFSIAAGGLALTASQTSVTAAVNDIVRINVTSADTITVATVGATGVTSISSPGNYDYTVTQASASLTFSTPSGACAGDTVTVSINGGAAGGTESAASSAPAPVMQQFGKPSSGTCTEAAPSTLNWGGAPSGGWGESWAQWMNGGLGGAVCSRTLVYSQSAEAWTVA